MHMTFRTSLTLCAAAVLLVACGKKQEPAPAAVVPASAPVAAAPAADSNVVKIGHRETVSNGRCGSLSP